MLMDISQVQVEGRESISFRFYNLCYLPIEYSKVKQILDNWKSSWIHVCETREVRNATFVAANIWFIPTLERIIGCETKGSVDSRVSPEEFFKVARDVVIRGHKCAKSCFWIGAVQYEAEIGRRLEDRLENQRLHLETQLENRFTLED